MYRKYILTKTNVINPHHYLLETQQTSTSTPTLFHQILISTTLNLPTIITQQQCLNIIQQSQNQNLISQTNHKYQIYLDNNLLQIRIKDKIGLINEICQKSDIKELLKIVMQFNVDLLLASRQLLSDGDHEMEGMSNVNKFFYRFVCIGRERSFMVLPFHQGDKIYYYDLNYSNQFGISHQKQKQKSQFNQSFHHKTIGQQNKSLFHRNLNVSTNSRQKFKMVNVKKMVKGKSNILEDKYYTQDEIFLKYLNFIVLIFKKQTIIQFSHELSKLNDSDIESIDISQLLQTLQKIGIQNNCKIFKNLIGLVSNSLKHYKEYTLNIFHKECEILIEKYERMMVKNQNQVQKTNKGFISNLLQTKNSSSDKEKTSKSCIVVNQSQQYRRPQLKNKLMENQSSQVENQSQKRLKGSKSLINLKSPSKSHSKSRTLKKHENKLFAKSKDTFNAKDTSNIFKSTWMSHLKSNHQNQLSKLNQKTSDVNFGKSTISSHWFGSSQQGISMNERQIAKKLRGLKKKNNNISMTNTPQKRNSFKNQEEELAKSKFLMEKCNISVINEQNQVDQIQVNKYDIDKFLKSKKSKNVEEKMKHNQNFSEKIQLRSQQDKFTMTQSNQAQNQIIIKKIEKTKNNQNEISNQIKKQNQKTKQIQTKSKGVGIKETFQQQKQKQKMPYFQSAESKLQKTKQNQTIKQDKSSHDKLNKSKMVQKSIKLKKTATMIIPQQQNQDQIQNVSLLPSKFQPKQEKPVQKTSNKLHQYIVNQKNKGKQSQKMIQKNETKIIKKSVLVQSDYQRVFYIKIFQLILKFYKQNFAKITILPQANNISYLINFLYFKILIQSKFTQKSSMYGQLTGLLVKKQQKIPQQMKKQSQIYYIQLENLWQAGKDFQIFQQPLKDNILDPKLPQLIESKRVTIQFLSKISSQSSQILQKILKNTYTYLYQHKIALLQKNMLTTLLELCYLLSIIMIISLQKTQYYRVLEEKRLHQVEKCFKFKFQNSQDQYLKNYRKYLEGKNMAFMNIQEEYQQVSNWVDEYNAFR